MGGGALTSTILMFAAIVAIGALLRGVKLLKDSDASALNAVIVYVGLPAFVFRAVHGARLGADLWRVVLLAWLVFGFALGIAWALSHIRAMERSRRGAFLLVSALGNTGYIGYPVTAALLGASAVPRAVFSDVFGTVFALVLVGLPLAARFGHAKKARVNLLKELATFPAVIALAAALLLRPVALPTVVSSGLDALANLVAPLIMLSVGLSLKPRSLLRGSADVALVALVRLVLAPAIALVAGGLILSGDALRVGVLEAGMPAMMLSLVVSERFGLDSDFTASAIFVTTLLAAVTVPLVQSVAF